MTWIFVDRHEQLETLRRAVRNGSPGTIIVTGEAGVGRSELLSRALAFADPDRDEVIRLGPADLQSFAAPPFAALCNGFPGILPSRPATMHEVVQAVTGSIGRRRLVIAVDDAHLVDRPSLLAAQEISCLGRALLLATLPRAAAAPGQPDPSHPLTSARQCAQDIRILTLDPLDVGEVAAVLAALLDGPVALPAAAAIHAATGGNPRQLRALASQAWLAQCMERQDGLWRLGLTEPGPGCATVRASQLDMERIISAAWSAWRELACERADQLCRLTLSHEAREHIAPIWAMLLTLRGRAWEAVTFLGSLPADHARTTPRSSLVMALALAIGTGRVEEASDFLLQAAARAGSQLLMAYRAWILAMTGRLAMAAIAAGGIEPEGLEAAMFVHATRGLLARADDRVGDAVSHFRHALAIAETESGDCPWMRPLLRAPLIDSLLLSGRTADAASMTRRFHAREPGSGWEFALAMEALLGPGIRPSSRGAPA